MRYNNVLDKSHLDLLLICCDPILLFVSHLTLFKIIMKDI